MEFGSENGGTRSKPLSQGLNEPAHLLAEPEPEPARALERALELGCTPPDIHYSGRELYWGEAMKIYTPALELARALAGARAHALERLPRESYHSLICWAQTLHLARFMQVTAT